MLEQTEKAPTPRTCEKAHALLDGLGIPRHSGIVELTLAERVAMAGREVDEKTPGRN